MPRPVSAAILRAKKLGKRFNLLHIDLSIPLFLTDNTFDYTYANNKYLANGLLLNVDPGAMTAGVESNDWTIKLSAVFDDIFTNVLSKSTINRWVYHYVAYFEEDANGINIIGIEAKKHGQILFFDDSDDEKSAVIEFTITGPLGNAEQTNEVKTNNLSQERRWGPDKIFQFAHETDFTLPPSIYRYTPGTIGGTKVSDIPSISE